MHYNHSTVQDTADGTCPASSPVLQMATVLLIHPLQNATCLLFNTFFALAASIATVA